MFNSEVQIRVRYAETDRMGYVYYGNYATYFEVARVEALRQLGLSYRAMEDDGIIMPVLDFQIKYFKPALYDDLLTIKLSIKHWPTTRLHFDYETFNEGGDIINKGSTTLVFVNKSTMRPTHAPENFIESLRQYFDPIHQK